MLDEQRFGDDGSSATRSVQAGNRYEKVYETCGEITYHWFIVTKASHMTGCGNLSHSCEK